MTIDTVGAESASVTGSQFDPADWLERFRAIGGVCLTDGTGAPAVSWQMLGRTPDDIALAQSIYREIDGDDDRGKALVELLCAERRASSSKDNLAAELPPLADAVLDAYNSGQLRGSEAWQALLTRYNEIEATPSGGMPEDEYDRLVSLGGDLGVALMSMPAPNSAALIWKLDNVVANGNWYAADDLRQTIADYRRMLGNVGADTEIEAAWALRQETLLRHEALPLIDPPEGEIETPEEAACWVIIDQADEVIRSTIARTPRGAAIQLKVALYNCCDIRDDEELFIRGDFAALETKGYLLNRSAPHTIAALRSLEAQALIAGGE